MPTLAEVRAFIRELPDVVSVAVVQEAATDRLLQLDADQRPVITPDHTGRITATIRPACLRLSSCKRHRQPLPLPAGTRLPSRVPPLHRPVVPVP